MVMSKILRFTASSVFPWQQATDVTAIERLSSSCTGFGVPHCSSFLPRRPRAPFPHVYTCPSAENRRRRKNWWLDSEWDLQEALIHTNLWPAAPSLNNNSICRVSEPNKAFLLRKDKGVVVLSPGSCYNTTFYYFTLNSKNYMCSPSEGPRV